MDTTLNQAVDASGNIILLNGITPGVGFSQRIGRQICVKRIDAQLTTNVAPSVGADQFHRFLLVLDHQPNGAALSIADVLDSISVRAMPNLSNQARFKILRDEVHYLNASTEPSSGIPMSFSIGKTFVVQYNSGSAGTVVDISTNSLYFISIGSIAVGTDAGLVAGTIRVRYTDE